MKSEKGEKKRGGGRGKKKERIPAGKVFI